MKNEREGFRKVFRKVSEVFREVPDDSGDVRNVLEGDGSFRKGPEGSGIFWKVPEDPCWPHPPLLEGQGSRWRLHLLE
jgi:hypothetical protein